MKLSECVAENGNFWLLILHGDSAEVFFYLLLFHLYILVLLPWRNLLIWPHNLYIQSRKACRAGSFLTSSTQGLGGFSQEAGPGARQEKTFATLSNPSARKLGKRDAAGNEARQRLDGPVGTPCLPSSVFLWFHHTLRFPLWTDMHLDTMHVMGLF